MISIKTDEQIKIMRDAGKILSEVFDELGRYFKIGVNAAFLDDIARKTIERNGAKPSFLGYQGYKYSTCVSKNEEIVHGIPYPEKTMLPGDICSIDCGVYYKGYHADAARIFTLAPLDSQVQTLVDITTESFWKGIEQAVPGNKLGDISYAIQSHVEPSGFSVVRDLYSHGIGKELHEDPLIPNYGKKGSGLTLEKGMTFAIEPMVNIGCFDILTLQDKWTIITADKKWSAHYENTIYIGDHGAEVLTMSS